MDENDIDVILATSPQNVQYLLGGYRFFFFEGFDAIGLSRYLPCLGYRRHGDGSFYIGNPMEAWQQDYEELWVRRIENVSWTTTETARIAAHLLRSVGAATGTVGVERSFLPDDAREVLERALPEARFVEALPVLEELRAVKRPDELELLRRAASSIVESMLAVIDGAEPGEPTAAIAERLRREETTRGLSFEYCAVSAGRSPNRAPSPAPWNEGDVLSLDSGGSLHGYIGDLARMACMGEPTSLMQELLAEIDAVQVAAREAIRAGSTGREMYEAADASRADCPHGSEITFVGHGMGLVSHEAPRLSETAGPPYPATHRDRRLEPGMVLSLETQLYDDRVGFVKLEDTVVVTESGCEAFGDAGRGWNVPAKALSRT
jgi:Xaa-Pro aminopeptidase